MMMYGLTLMRIKSEFGLTNVEAGALGSLTLVGMELGGVLGGWCSDALGRVRLVVSALALFSWARACWALHTASCSLPWSA